jgi:hypothetical protein
MKPDLDAIEKRAAALARGQWRRARVGISDVFVQREAGQDAAQLHAADDVGEAVMAAGADLKALAAEVRRLQAQVEAEDARARAAVRTAPASKAAPSAELEEEVSALLAAPFHVSAKATKAAQSDPLVALAVQASKALQPDAKDIERARLIAMSLAATTGDMEAFWAARKQRSTKAAKGAKKKA